MDSKHRKITYLGCGVMLLVAVGANMADPPTNLPWQPIAHIILGLIQHVPHQLIKS